MTGPDKGDPSWSSRRYQVALDIGKGMYDSTPAYDGKVTPPAFSQPIYQTVMGWSRGSDVTDPSDDVIAK